MSKVNDPFDPFVAHCPHGFKKPNECDLCCNAAREHAMNHDERDNRQTVFADLMRQHELALRAQIERDEIKPLKTAIEALRKELDAALKDVRFVNEENGKLEERIKELEGALNGWLEYYDVKPPGECFPMQGWVDSEGEMIGYGTATARTNIFNTIALLEERKAIRENKVDK